MSSADPPLAAARSFWAAEPCSGAHLAKLTYWLGPPEGGRARLSRVSASLAAGTMMPGAGGGGAAAAKLPVSLAAHAGDRRTPEL